MTTEYTPYVNNLRIPIIHLMKMVYLQPLYMVCNTNMISTCK